MLNKTLSFCPSVFVYCPHSRVHEGNARCPRQRSHKSVHYKRIGDSMFDEHDELIRVAAAVIKDGDKYLVCQRGINHRYGLKWEFPGGKTLPGEPLRECLERELWEELDMEPVRPKELKTIQTSYSDGGKFLITFFLVTEYTGIIRNKVFEDIKWATLEEIPTYEMLEGSLPILPYLS
jgi:8-oxo-dGTP diphosphatase